MKCPSGGECFDVNCLTSGCQGYDVLIESVTVTRTTIKRRAVMSLIVGTSAPKSTGNRAPSAGETLDLPALRANEA